MDRNKHHELMLGVLACCFPHVPDHLKRAIHEGITAAKELGFNVNPDSLELVPLDLPSPYQNN